MDYGLATYDEGGVEISRFDRPIMALRSIYINTATGSVYVPGCFGNAKAFIVSYYAINTSVVGMSGPPIATINNDDTISWTPSAAATVLPAMLFVVFYR